MSLLSRHSTSLTTLHRRRFPVISGFRVLWDSRKPPGHRVIGIWQQKEVEHDGINSGHRQVDDHEVKREKTGRKYKIVTREYMAQGHDGFLSLKDGKYLIDDESGQMMSTLVRQYLLVSKHRSTTYFISFLFWRRGPAL